MTKLVDAHYARYKHLLKRNQNKCLRWKEHRKLLCTIPDIVKQRLLQEDRLIKSSLDRRNLDDRFKRHLGPTSKLLHPFHQLLEKNYLGRSFCSQEEVFKTQCISRISNHICLMQRDCASKLRLNHASTI